jgi:uncharacterized membrane protein YeaQ/YmgE (transglycosylase-associated protein family)
MSSVIAWIIVGLLSGFLANRMIGGSKKPAVNLFAQLALGAAGALIAGTIYETSSLKKGTDFVDIWSVFVAAVGATLLLGASRFFLDRDRPKRRPAR